MRTRKLRPLINALAGSLVCGCVHAEVMGCLVEPDRVADVGSQSMGVLENMLVERGDTVVAGQVVARLAAQVERASASVAQARSQVDAELRQAMAAYELAQRKLSRARDLVKQNFVSGQAVDQADAEARVAEQRIAQAREAQQVAKREYSLSSAQLGQRDVRSPFSGIVVERYRTEGERIEREPVIRVARIDPLRVEAIVPAAQFGSITTGQMATVKTDLPHFSALSARVVLVDRVIDPASNSFRVRLTIPNPDNRIPSGLRCRLDFAVSGPAGAAPGQPGHKAAAVSRKPPNMAVSPKPPTIVPTTARVPEPAVVVPAPRAPKPAPVAAPMPAPARLQPVVKWVTPAVQLVRSTLPAEWPPRGVASNLTRLTHGRLGESNKEPGRAQFKVNVVMPAPRLTMSLSMNLPRTLARDSDQRLAALR